MDNDPNSHRIAAAMSHPARALMLSALAGGEALTARELAIEAGITRQIASSHLAELLDAQLVRVNARGRHRYFRVADVSVRAALESSVDGAARTGTRRFRPGPDDPALRKARVCRDHLAGCLAVEVHDALVRRALIRPSETEGAETLTLTRAGRRFFDDLNLNLTGLDESRRPICRPCLDWSVRRNHLAGTLGRGLLEHCFQQRWARRVENTRVVVFTTRGEDALRKAFAF